MVREADPFAVFDDLLASLFFISNFIPHNPLARALDFSSLGLLLDEMAEQFVDGSFLDFIIIKGEHGREQ